MADGRPRVEFRASAEVAQGFRKIGDRDGSGEVAAAVVAFEEHTLPLGGSLPERLEHAADALRRADPKAREEEAARIRREARLEAQAATEHSDRRKQGQAERLLTDARREAAGLLAEAEEKASALIVRARDEADALRQEAAVFSIGALLRGPHKREVGAAIERFGDELFASYLRGSLPAPLGSILPILAEYAAQALAECPEALPILAQVPDSKGAVKTAQFDATALGLVIRFCAAAGEAAKKKRRPWRPDALPRPQVTHPEPTPANLPTGLSEQDVEDAGMRASMKRAGLTPEEIEEVVSAPPGPPFLPFGIGLGNLPMPSSPSRE